MPFQVMVWALGGLVGEGGARTGVSEITMGVSNAARGPTASGAMVFVESSTAARFSVTVGV